VTVWVVGSINVDIVSRVDRLPTAGETVSGSDLERVPGGKGANQAVATARLGAPTRFVGCVGDDADGGRLLAFLADHGVDASRVRTVDRPTGVAIVLVGASGENQIVVTAGANGRVGPDELRDLTPDRGDIVLCQGEIPAETSRTALEVARAVGAIGIVDPAPASPNLVPLCEVASIATPNEREVAVLAGRSSEAVLSLDEVETCARSLIDGADHLETVVVTLAERGALVVSSAAASFHSPGRDVQVVDTTGAGDCFTGALAVGLSDGLPIAAAVARANIAASLAISATRQGWVGSASPLK
jgi:ribokinase